MKVLVIEDNQDIRELLRRLIEVMHYIPVCTDNGKEGFEKAALEKPDVILMDFMLPGMDGFETTRLLRATPSTKESIDVLTRRPATIVQPFSIHPLYREL